MKKIGFVGAGQMAQALAAGIAAAYEDIEFEIADPSDDSKKQFCAKIKSNVTLRETNGDIFRHCDVVFLAMKPQYFAGAVDGQKIQSAMTGRAGTPLLISIIVGLPIESIAAASGLNRVARVMPNTPCLVMEGASAVSFSDAVEPAEKQSVLDLLGSVGVVQSVPESLLDAVTGVSGSGPAYVYTFIESLIDGGVLQGLPRPIARKLAIQTVIGAAQMVDQSGEHPAVLRDRVTSPGGTTIEALRVLEVNNFRGTVIQAVQAAADRAKALGEK